jgi:hypothetical protein
LIDINSVAQHGLSQEKLKMLMIEDSSIDTFLDFCVGNSTTPTKFEALPVWKTALMRAHAQYTPLEPSRLPVEVKVVMAPCVLRDSHWSLIILDMNNKVAILYDPMYEPDVEMLRGAQNILRGLKTVFSLEQDIGLKIEKDCRFQEYGSHDCGAHISLFAQQICQEKPIRPIKDMNNYRFYMRRSILMHLGFIKDDSQLQQNPAPPQVDKRRIQEDEPKQTIKKKKFEEDMKKPEEPSTWSYKNWWRKFWGSGED